MNTPAASPLKTCAFSSATFIDDAAAFIVARHAGELPDLSAVRIVAPPRAATELKQALMRAAAARGHASLFLPAIDTLPAFAAHFRVEQSAAPASNAERVLSVFQALKRQKWFSSAEALRVARELVRLIDGLTHEMAALPKSAEEHAKLLARAYAIARHNEDFSFEARLTYDIWRALAHGDALDLPAHYALQLSAWARQASAETPLYLFDANDWSRRERAFFAEHAERGPVTMFQRVFADDSPRGAFIARAFAAAPGAPAEASLSSGEPGTDGIRAGVARDVEHEATAALAALKTWLQEGKRHIAVVALDRQAARRLRALAERDGILMQDEVGWPYSTTLSGTAIMRWLEAKQDGYYHSTLIDLIKSPFIFSDWRDEWGGERLKSAVLTIERAVKREGVVSGLSRMRDAVRATAQEQADAIAVLDRLAAADEAFATHRRTAAAWLSSLRQGLVSLGIEAALLRDIAGRGLVLHLDQLEQEVATVDIPLAAGEWVDWLRGQLEELRFRDASIASSIVLTSLEATRYRRFEAAIVIGASMPHLPGAPAGEGVFNQSVRRSLGLRSYTDELESITRDLAALLQAVPVCRFSWQSDEAREPVPPAPWLHALALEARRAGGEIIEKLKNETPALVRLSGQKWLERRADAGVSKLTAPAPKVGKNQLPARITASQYQSLIDCPYQYFARAVLGLRESDEVQEEMEKRDFGVYVHAILNRFHRRFPLTIGIEQDALLAALREETAAEFANALKQNFTANAWRLSWESAMTSYLDWHRAREEEGWRWAEGEWERAVVIEFDDGGALKLEGRLDRVDRRGAENRFELAVLDYKTAAVNSLRDKIKIPGEDVQLPVYAALAGAGEEGRPVVQAQYLAVARDEVRAVDYPDPADAGGEAVVRLAGLFKAMRHGAVLPAQGIATVCDRCEMRGLCRRDHWEDA